MGKIESGKKLYLFFTVFSQFCLANTVIMAWVIHALCWSCCFRSPCLALLKLKDWNPPVSADESMTSTPYSLWFRRYSVTAMTSTTTVTTPAARPEYSATSLLLSISARRRENTFEEKYTMTKQWLWFFWKLLYKGIYLFAQISIK